MEVWGPVPADDAAMPGRHRVHLLNPGTQRDVLHVRRLPALAGRTAGIGSGNALEPSTSILPICSEP